MILINLLCSVWDLENHRRVSNVIQNVIIDHDRQLAAMKVLQTMETALPPPRFSPFEAAKVLQRTKMLRLIQVLQCARRFTSLSPVWSIAQKSE